MKKKFYWRFSRKIEGEFWIFYKRFPWEKNWMEEIFKRISLKNWSWIHTRASLARAVFSFKTFFDCEWRSHLPSPTTSTSWTEKRAKRVLVDSEVRGTTPQKLIVDSEGRGTTPQKLIMDESEKSESESEKSESIFGPLFLFKVFLKTYKSFIKIKGPKTDHSLFTFSLFHFTSLHN